MSRMCGECGERIEEDDAWGLYDGAECHAVCIAEAEDEADFDNWFINK